MSEFSGLPFVAGDVRGIRSWDVDPMGRLISPTYKSVWTPGENAAECKKKDYASGGWIIPSTFFSYDDSALRRVVGLSPKPSTVTVSSISEAAVEKPEPPEPPHTQAACSCGFYAYSNGYNDYADDTRLTGVIQGYGETQLGTRGFKCSKARVVALHIPSKVGKLGRRQVTNEAGHFARVRDNYPNVAIFDKYADMVEAFPVYEHTPTPETDPDFWTRGIS